MSQNPPIDANPQIVIDMRPDPDYWLALGEFVESFASTEISLFYFLIHTAHLSAPVARALFGAERAAEYVTLIKHVWQVEPPTESVRAELESVFAQFGEINATRNIIIHYPSVPHILKDLRRTSDGNQRVTNEGDRRATSGDARRISSNMVRAIDPDRPNRERAVSAQIVRGMTADLLKIQQHVMSLYAYSKQSFDERADAFPGLRSAWRYARQQAPH